MAVFRKDRPPPGERILAAADKLFYTKGIRAIGVDAIAAAADVSKRTLYNYYASKDELVAAYLNARFRLIAPSDKPPAQQILGVFDRLEKAFGSPDFRGCPFVNAVAEIGDPKHAARSIAFRFKEGRRQWFKDMLGRAGVREPDALAMQMQILVDGAIAAVLVRADPAVARSACDAAETLLRAAKITSAAPVRSVRR